MHDRDVRLSPRLRRRAHRSRLGDRAKSIARRIIAALIPLPSVDRRASALAQQIRSADDGAAARHVALVEIMTTVNRLSQEWNDSDRIDMIVRIATQREASEPRRWRS